MHEGKLVFAQLMEHVPLHTFRRCVAQYPGRYPVQRFSHLDHILAKGGRYWIYEYLFAKKDRANIQEDELKGFRLLAKSYAALTSQQVDKLIQDGHFLEICHEH